MAFYNNTRLAYIYLQSNICLECQTCFLLHCTDRPTRPVIISDTPLDSRNLLKALLVVQANNAVRTHISLQCSNTSSCTFVYLSSANGWCANSKLSHPLALEKCDTSRTVNYTNTAQLFLHITIATLHICKAL